MTVKKLALLALASVATLGVSLSMADGPAACDSAADVSGVYVGADVGAFNNDSATTFVDDHGTHNIKRNEQHVPWGWTASALVGYQFNSNLALQFGYIWNQDQKVEQSTTYSVSTGYANKFTSYNLYLAAKGIAPLMDAFSAYLLAGVAYTHVNQKISGSDYSIFGTPVYVVSDTASWWSPMGALGVSYSFDQNLSINVQWMYIMNQLSSKGGTTGTDTLKREYRGTSRVTLGANYLFVM